jgi:hypothetical protein
MKITMYEKAPGFSLWYQKKGRQDRLFTSLADISDRFLISLADLVLSTHPSIAQSMQSADKSSVGLQISGSCCKVLINGRPGSIVLHLPETTS